MEALSSLESVLHAALFVAAAVVAGGGAVRGLRSPSARGTGEVVWSGVAIAALAAVYAVAGLGGGHGG